MTKLTADDRFSEVEKQRQMTSLCESVVPEIEKTATIANQVAALAEEKEAAVLRQALSGFDSARLLAIAQSLASRTREARMSAYVRAKSGNDTETMAAMLTAPRELGATDGLDPRLLDALRDHLIDSVDPGVREGISATRFALARFNHGRQSAIATLRKMTSTPEPATRIVRASG